MIMSNDLPQQAKDDPFHPPDKPCPVRCLHCGQEYCSSEIIWRSEKDGKGFWCCPVEGCDGKGFNFDIFALDSELWTDIDDEDEEGEGGDAPPDDAGE